MSKSQNLHCDDLHYLSREVVDIFTTSSIAENEYSIFLCGGKSTSSRSYRYHIKNKIESKTSKYSYQVYYPEDLFIELLYGHERDNLLSLENLLARSVSAIAIIVESAGALVELGAFSNHERLSEKLIVVVEEQFRMHSSFINLGPVRHLRKKGKDRVIYAPFNPYSSAQIAQKICNGTRSITETTTLDKSISNPILSYRIYLAFAYCFAPLSKTALYRIVKSITNTDEEIRTVIETALFSLVSKGDIVLKSDELVITSSGQQTLLKKSLTNRKTELMIDKLSSIRKRYLNRYLRGKVYREAERAARPEKVREL